MLYLKKNNNNNIIYKMELNIQKLDNRSEEDSKQYDEKDLKKIEKDVIELSEVFTIVQDMVEHQKNDIDNIETSIDKTSEYVILSQNDLDDIKKSNLELESKKNMIYSCSIIVISIPITIMSGPITGMCFAIFGISSVKAYSILKGKNQVNV